MTKTNTFNISADGKDIEEKVGRKRVTNPCFWLNFSKNHTGLWLCRILITLIIITITINFILMYAIIHLIISFIISYVLAIITVKITETEITLEQEKVIKELHILSYNRINATTCWFVSYYGLSYIIVMMALSILVNLIL